MTATTNTFLTKVNIQIDLEGQTVSEARWVNTMISVQVNTNAIPCPHLEVFEAEDVEDSDESRLECSWVGALVDGVDEPGKRSGVQALGHRMTVLTSLVKWTHS